MLAVAAAADRTEFICTCEKFGITCACIIPIHRTLTPHQFT